MNGKELEKWWKEHNLKTVWTLNEVVEGEGIYCRGIFEDQVTATLAQNKIKDSINRTFWIKEDPIITLSTLQKFGELE